MAQTSAKKLEQTGPAKKERVDSAPHRAVGKNAAGAFSNTKRNRAISPDHQIVRWERAKLSKSHTLVKKRVVRAGAWRGKDQLLSDGRWV